MRNTYGRIPKTKFRKGISWQTKALFLANSILSPRQQDSGSAMRTLLMRLVMEGPRALWISLGALRVEVTPVHMVGVNCNQQQSGAQECFLLLGVIYIKWLYAEINLPDLSVLLIFKFNNLWKNFKYGLLKILGAFQRVLIPLRAEATIHASLSAHLTYEWLSVPVDVLLVK